MYGRKLPMTDTPTHMTVMAVPNPGGPDAFAAEQRPVPTPGPGEVLVRVAAAAVNRPDVMQRQGNYPPPPGAPDIPGLDIAGTIAAVAPDVTAWQTGDTVCALVAGGGYAEYCLAPAAQCLPVPEALDMVQAAALPETFFTVWTNLFDQGALAEGESVLIHGGSSGIGTTAIQLAREWGATIYTTAGSAEKCTACEALGAARAINYRTEDFVDVIGEVTEGRGVNVVMDMVAGDYVNRNLKILAPRGRLLQIAVQQGIKAEVNLLYIMSKRLVLTGSQLRPRPVAEKGEIAASLREKVWPLIEAGRVAPVIHATFPLSDAAGAHRLMESSTHIGKIVLTV